MEFDHFIIRPLTLDDLHPYYEMVQRNRERLKDFFTGTVSRTKTIEDTKEFLAEIVERAKIKTYMPYLIVDNTHHNFIGFLDLKNIDWSIPKAEIGCYIDKDFAGQHIGLRAFQLFCDYSFQNFGFRKLFLRTHHTNTAAQRIAETSGFQKEGIIRWDYKTTAGELVDLIYYGRLNK